VPDVQILHVLRTRFRLLTFSPTGFLDHGY
jgi:hypothetical protein